MQKIPKPFASLLTMAMKEGKTLKAYSDRYWELYNEIGGNNRVFFFFFFFKYIYIYIYIYKIFGRVDKREARQSRRRVCAWHHEVK